MNERVALRDTILLRGGGEDGSKPNQTDFR